MTLPDFTSLSIGSTVAIEIIAIAFGLLNCFFGYRIFRVLLGIYGFVVGAGVGIFVASNLAAGQALWLAVGAVAGGIIGAVLMVLLYFVGVFVVGAFGGVLLVNAIGAVTGFAVPTVVVIIAAVVVGILALILQRAVLVLLTAFAGAWAAVSGGALLLAGRSLPAISIIARPATWEQANLPMLAILISWLVLGVVGMSVQFRATRERRVARARRQPEEPRDVW
jgi:hypothetical protein